MLSSKWYRYTAAGFIFLGLALALVYWFTGFYMYFTHQVSWADVVTFDTAVGGKWQYPTPYTLIFVKVWFTALSAISMVIGCILALIYDGNKKRKDGRRILRKNL